MSRRTILCVGCGVFTWLAAALVGRGDVLLSNPHWEMDLTDAGYSDYLGDMTPGFEYREYLSGEWGAAVGYKVGATTVAPTWLQQTFYYPDWPTYSNFNVDSPMTVTGTGLGGHDTLASARLVNPDLTVTVTCEMVDTVLGTKMGLTPANSAAPAASIESDRYVLKQTYTIKNTNPEEETISNLNLFQFLHALNGVATLYDPRNYAGQPDQLGQYHYDTTQTALDGTLRDYIGFGGQMAPIAFDNGMYGTFAADNHVIGKPSVGVHLSVEADALGGADQFAPDPVESWVSGAQKYSLGTLEFEQEVSFTVLLSIRTGTDVTVTGPVSGGANGGAGDPGQVDFSFEDVTNPGAVYATYDVMDAHDLAEHIAAGKFTSPDFSVPGDFQVFEIEFDGEHDGDIQLVLHYDDTFLPVGFDEELLSIYHYHHGVWTRLATQIDALANTALVTVGDLSPFAVGAVPEPASAALLAVGGLLLLTRRPCRPSAIELVSRR